MFADISLSELSLTFHFPHRNIFRFRSNVVIYRKGAPHGHRKNHQPSFQPPQIPLPGRPHQSWNRKRAGKDLKFYSCGIHTASGLPERYRAGIFPSTVTEMLKSLESRDLIVRIPDENDGRFKRIAFTEKAAAVKDALNQEIHETEALLLRGISEQELMEFTRITEKMLQNLDSEEKSSSPQ